MLMTRRQALAILWLQIGECAYIRDEAHSEFQVAFEDADVDRTYSAWLRAKDAYVASVEAHSRAAHAVIFGDDAVAPIMFSGVQ